MNTQAWERRKGVLRELVRRPDPVLFLCSLYLSLLSILTIYGAVDNFGMSKLKMQIAVFLLGTVVVLIMAYFDYHTLIDRFYIWIFAGSVLLLILTLLLGSTGESRETSNKSWLEIPLVGIAIQPSEFVKLFFICTFAKHLKAVQSHINRIKTVIFLVLHAGTIVGLILLSGDLGVALIYGGIILIMLFCAGLHWGYFLTFFGLVAIAFPFLWNHMQYYQQMRILVGFNPELDPDLYGWQALLSKKAIASGGFFGKGLKSGGYYETLPCSHTDFMFATICEKFGYVGGASVIIAYLIIIVRTLRMARAADTKDYGGLICVGIAGMLICQVTENIGMCCAMLPVIGITLPFLSCGGSSMLATFMMFGLLHSVYAHSGEIQRRRRNL